jgi:hypothetical protein
MIGRKHTGQTACVRAVIADQRTAGGGSDHLEHVACRVYTALVTSANTYALIRLRAWFGLVDANYDQLLERLRSRH